MREAREPYARTRICSGHSTLREGATTRTDVEVGGPYEVSVALFSALEGFLFPRRWIGAALTFWTALSSGKGSSVEEEH